MLAQTLVVLSIFALCACGVKGKPLPPLEPVPLGDGTLPANKTEKKRKTPSSPTKTAPRGPTRG